MFAVGMAVTCPRTDPYVHNYRVRLLPKVWRRSELWDRDVLLSHADTE